MNEQSHHHHGHALQTGTHLTVDLAALHAASSGPTPAASSTRTPQDVHVTLEARETSWEVTQDTVVPAWGYQGTVPGPLIFANAGDTLVAHLINRLPEPTVIHWHGIRLASSMDGTESVQTLVQPGDSFEYRFVLPDAGTYWYHSHHNETVQLERGLYGAIVVLGENEPAFDADRVMMLDDVTLDRKGRIARPGLFDRHSGREGGLVVINGRSQPELEIAAGQVERWRIVNAASARYVRLSLGGRPFRIIGADGGLREAPITVTETLLTPGDRVELAVGPFENEGAEIAIESLPYRRSRMVRPRYQRWGTLHVRARKPSRARIPEAFGPIIPLLPSDAVTTTRTIRLGARMTLRGHDWLINGETHHRDAPVKAGELQVWEIVNETGMDHPFHLHGFFFQVVAIDGVLSRPTAWEDTVNVPAKRRVTIAFRPDARPGEWMYHCHILEHHATGMMGHFEVTA
ncbi:MAG TPA: multicopper oxidase family protein [Kofleriaceae bacterium]|nr:multicopper oxidase family protein [Kofleriaceae bacterium]